MPEELFVLFVLAILSFTILSIIGMTMRYKSKNAQRNIGSGSSSLTTSELERMMKRAVRSAIGPLEEKLETLEDALVLQNTPRQIEASKVDLLSDMDLHLSEDAREKESVRTKS